MNWNSFPSVCPNFPTLSFIKSFRTEFDNPVIIFTLEPAVYKGWAGFYTEKQTDENSQYHFNFSQF